MRIAVALLVAPGAHAAPAAAALRAAGVPDVLEVALERAGATAQAANTALEGAGDADVLALVDDDVLVGAGWWTALRTAWAPGVAVVRGPVAAAGAPAWLRGAHDEVLGLGDGAGNVAFRLAALRGVGGFFPVRGHADARDGFGAIALARDDLRAAGWSDLVVPGLAARRDLTALTPVALLRRRLRTGARRSALGQGRGRAAGLRTALRAGAAAAAGLARGDRAVALDRAAWAADGAGVVLGAALVHRELQPDRPQTTLRAAVPAPAPHPLTARRPPRPSRRPILGAVLLYHRVAALEHDPLRLAVAPGRFAQQLEALRRGWTPVGLETLLAGEGGPHAVAITFDDGYHDNLLAAAPALEAAGLTATLFASTGHVAGGDGFWWDEVARLLASPAAEPLLELTLPEGPRAWAPRDAAQRATVAAHVRGALQTRDAATLARALEELRAWAGALPGPPPPRDRPLTVGELSALAASPAFTVGAHGRTHLSLAHTAPAQRAAELAGSAEDLERWLGARPAAFAYPFGVPGVDVDAPTRAAAAAAGYAWGVLNHPGLVRAGGDPYAIPRLAVPDLDGATFARWLDTALPRR